MCSFSIFHSELFTVFKQETNISFFERQLNVLNYLVCKIGLSDKIEICSQLKRKLSQKFFTNLQRRLRSITKNGLKKYEMFENLNVEWLQEEFKFSYEVEVVTGKFKLSLHKYKYIS